MELSKSEVGSAGDPQPRGRIPAAPEHVEKLRLYDQTYPKYACVLRCTGFEVLGYQKTDQSNTDIDNKHH
jgi:hypothetical protein